MTPHHHLNEATLVSLASGALSPEMAAVAATHVEACEHCRAMLADAEHIGGLLLLGLQQGTGSDASRQARLRSAIWNRLGDSTAGPGATAFEARPGFARPADPERLPRALQGYFGDTWSALRWRWVAPGIQVIRAAQSGPDSLLLLKIAPGRSVPLHSHRGAELTQILKGAYDDVLGRFGPGDAADLDSETEHQPVAAPGTPCICVAALNAPLRFPGWLASKLQPLIGL